MPGYDLTAWYAFVAPAGTPQDIVAKLNTAINSALVDPEVRGKLLAAGFDVAGGTPDRLAQLMLTDSVKWEKVVKVKVD